MYLSLNWLKDFLIIPKGVKAEDIAAKLTRHTVEVEKIEKQSERFEKVVIGKVLEAVRHPNSDHLNLTKVDIGEKEPLSIVCGAPNVAAGQLVPVATVGAELPNGMKIEEREVRGEKSFGMICAADELGLGEDHSGIMVLDGKKAKIGHPFAEYSELEDVIFEVDNKSLTNRPDLWGHFGMAREIATLLDSKTTKEFSRIWSARLEDVGGEKKLDVKVEEKNLCPRYMAVKISGVEVKESPEEIKKRLIAAGSRPINNIVDATNYAMLELGQPLHAFDSSKAEKIVVRLAKNGEIIKTLDGQDRKLNENALLITDGERPLAIAGVMGGQSSEIENSTTEIILESACFDASSIRKTSTSLSLRTDASMRFEKTLDPNLCPIALNRCLELIKQTCPEAKIDSQIVDIANFSNAEKDMEIDLNWLASKIGQDLGKKRIVDILEALGFKVATSGHTLKINVPSFRANKDIKIEEDILEEIARVHGYDNIEAQAPLIKATAPEQNQERWFERRVKSILSLGASLSEVHNYSFLNEEKMSKLKMSSNGLVKLANPISGLHTHLRAELFPNILDNVRVNQAKYDKISIFEIGNVFADATGSIDKNGENGEKLPYQGKHLAIVIAEEDEKNAYDTAKGAIEHLLKEIGCTACRFEESSDGQHPEWAKNGTYAKILSSNEDLGFVSLLDKAPGIKKEVAIIEINFDKLFSLYKSWPKKKYREPNKYPAMTRDLAFVISNKVLYGNIKKEIEGFDALIKEVELFDVYEGANLPEGSKSLAFHVTYESAERTLETAEVDALQEKLLKHLEIKFEAKIRNF